MVTMAAGVNLNVPVKTAVFAVKLTEVVIAKRVSSAPAVHRVGFTTKTLLELFVYYTFI